MNLFGDLFSVIQACPERHTNRDPLWRVLKAAARSKVEASFAGETAQNVAFGPSGDIRFPYRKMGNIDSLDLFGVDELIMFAFYDANRGRYHRVVDFGANIGLHTLCLARAGFEVRSFEPDPLHYDILVENLRLNDVASDLRKAAVSVTAGQTEFIRVLGNTTGSHIAGAKKDPYGDLERFEVKVEAAEEHLKWADFAKIDIEGHEAALLSGLPLQVWQDTDAMVEVGSEDNAKAIFDHFAGSPVNLFSQLTGWKRVEALSDMPKSHHDGSLFISAKPEMPW